MNIEKEKLEQLILKYTTFTPVQTQHILSSKDEEGLTLFDRLKNNKKIPTAEQALSQLCEHLNVTFLPEIPFSEIPTSLVTDIPIHYAKTHSVLPFKEEDASIQILTSNPLNFETFNNLKVKFKKRVEPIMSFNYKIQEAINRVYEKNTQDFTDFEDIQAEEYSLNDPVIDLLEAHDEAPIIKLVNTILVRAVKERASDIHIEPYEKEIVIRFRVDGSLYSVLKIQKRLQNAIASRVKIMGKLNIAEKTIASRWKYTFKIGWKRY